MARHYTKVRQEFPDMYADLLLLIKGMPNCREKDNALDRLFEVRAWVKRYVELAETNAQRQIEQEFEEV